MPHSVLVPPPGVSAAPAPAAGYRDGLGEGHHRSLQGRSFQGRSFQGRSFQGRSFQDRALQDGAFDWRLAAACRDLPSRAVFSTRPAEAAVVLRACDGCRVRTECETVVDPAHTWFDGVSAGRLWRNGREVTLTGVHDDERESRP